MYVVAIHTDKNRKKNLSEIAIMQDYRTPRFTTECGIQTSCKNVFDFRILNGGEGGLSKEKLKCTKTFRKSQRTDHALQNIEFSFCVGELSCAQFKYKKKLEG